MDKETSEIVKLTERISKDPKSKLFVPLAEEYKKAGDVEMAIHVLSEGLKNNPTYITARSLLGRFLFETGDLETARKELEEVVKAIPDNLLAQRKLGDLYIMQENRAEALQHYKIALSLNPGDAEFASLISDIEAGADVRSKLQQQKTKPSRVEAVKPAPTAAAQQQARPPVVSPVQPAAPPSGSGQPAPISKAMPEQRTAQTRTAALSAEQAPQKAKWASEAAPKVTGKSAGSEETVAEREKVQAKAAEPPAVERKPVEEALTLEAELPEEILAVEPLEEEKPAAAIPPSGTEVFAEEIGEGMPEVIAEAQPAVTAAPEPAFATPEPDMERKPVLPEAEEEVPAPSAAEKPSTPGTEQVTDDFTTDTLAELYIAQGFYEKAISIYERMLADDPDSRGLKDKLERVRAMAVQTEESPIEAEIAEITGKKIDADVFQEAREYVPSAAAEETGELIEMPAAEVEELLPVPGEEAREYVPPADIAKKEEEITIDAELFVEPGEINLEAKKPGKTIEEGIFSEAKEYVPSVIEEGQPQPQGGAAGREQRPPYTDFEPREYIPPSAAPREEPEENVPVDANQPGLSRKETIDRLEHWLKNIKKEK